MPGFTELLLKISGDDRDARQKLRSLAAEMEAFGRLHESASVEVEDQAARARLLDLRKNLDELAAGTTDVRIQADIAAARAHVDEFVARLDILDGKDVTVKINTKTDGDSVEKVAGDMVGLAGNINKLASASQGADRETKSFFDRLSSTGVNMGPFTTQLRVAVPAIVALSGVVSALAGALGALIASAAAAAGGLVAIGVAGAAALGPIGALLIGVTQKLTSASQAQTNYKTTTQAVTSAQDQLKQAQDSVNQAQIQVQRSTAALTQARKDAAQQIAQDNLTAENALRSAQEQLTSSEFQAKQAEDALTLARQAARRAIVDEQLATTQAALSHKAALLQVQEARRQLATAEAGGDPLAIKEARLAIQQAEFQVQSTRIQSGRAQRDLNKSEKDGVNGAPGVVSARRAVHDSTQATADATRALRQAQDKLNQAQAESVAKSSQVVSAEQQVTDAHHQLAQAQTRAGQAAAYLAVQQQKADKALRAFNQSRGAIALERAFRPVQRIIGKGVDAVIGGMRKGLDALLPLIRKLEPLWVKLGRSMGRAIIDVARELTKPAWQRFFQFLLRSSRQALPLFTKGFIEFLRILRNIARAGMPFFLDALRRVDNFLRRIARSSKGINLDVMMANLRVWVRLMLQLGRLFLNFVEIGAGPGRKLVAFLARGAKAMADWLGTKDGQKSMHLFFQRTLPLARDLAIFVGRLVVLFLQLGEIMAPILDIALKPFNAILGVLIKVVDWLIRVAGGFKAWKYVILAVATVLASPIVLGTALVEHWRDIPKLLAGIWGHIKDLAGRLWGLIKTAIMAPMHFVTGRGLPNLFGGLIDVLKQLWGRIASVAKFFWDKIGHWIFFFPKTGYDDLKKDTVWIAGVLGRLWGGIKDVGSTIFHAIARGISGTVGRAYGWLRDATHTLGKVFGKIWGGIVDVVQGALSAIRTVVHGIVSAINFIVDKLGQVKDKISGAIPSLPGGGGFNPGDLLPSPPDLPGPLGDVTPWARGGVAKTPSYIVGEEAPRHPEVIIPENPAYRGRAISLWQTAAQMLGIPGFRKGGVSGKNQYSWPFGPGWRYSPGGFHGVRVDEGVDFETTGSPVYAMGAGRVVPGNWGFPGVAGLRLDLSGGAPSGPGIHPSSSSIYMYEGVQADVSGAVKSGQRIGHQVGTSNEVGFAASSGQPIAQTYGGPVDPSSHHSPAGEAFWAFLQAIKGNKPIGAAGGALLSQLIKLQMPKFGGMDGPAKAIAEGGTRTMINAANDYLTHIERPLMRAPSGGGKVPFVAGGNGSVVEQVARILMSEGFTSRAAAGILGNAYRESLPPWNPASVGTGGGGLWGFTTPPQSLADLQAYAHAQGKSWTDPALQTQFMLIHGGLALKGAINAERSAAGAARYFEQNWEHAGVVAMSDRIHGAKLALSIIQRMHPGKAAAGLRNWRGGPLMVGENGPELLWAGAGTNVENNTKTRELVNPRFVVNGDIVSDHPEPIQMFMGDKKVAAWVRELASEEAQAEVAFEGSRR